MNTIEVISVPEIKIISLQEVLLPMSEDAAYESGTIQNGYGRATGVFATVQKGTSADLNINFTVTTVSEERFNKWKEQISSFFSSEERKMLDERWGAKGRMGGFLAAAFGLSFGGSANHYVNSSKSYNTASNTQREGLAQSVYNLETSRFRVTGKLKAVGTSFIPVTVSAYIQATQFTFSDNKKLTVINTENPIAGQQNGSTDGVSSQPTNLNLIPLDS